MNKSDKVKSKNHKTVHDLIEATHEKPMYLKLFIRKTVNKEKEIKKVQPIEINIENTTPVIKSPSYLPKTPSHPKSGGRPTIVIPHKSSRISPLVSPSLKNEDGISRFVDSFSPLSHSGAFSYISDSFDTPELSRTGDSENYFYVSPCGSFCSNIS